MRESPKSSGPATVNKAFNGRIPARWRAPPLIVECASATERSTPSSVKQITTVSICDTPTEKIYLFANRGGPTETKCVVESLHG
jgi:hypothetical protein